MRLRTIGLALAVSCLAASGPALAQFAGAPPGAFMPAGAMWAPGGQMMPGGGMPPPGGTMGGPMRGPMGGPMTGGYPGMPPVMPYPPPFEGDGCGPCGCGGPSCGDECCDECCHTFGRYGGGHGGDVFPEGDGSAHWRARVEPVLLSFRLPEQPAILSQGSLGDRAGIGNLDFDKRLGVRLSLEARLPSGSSLETVFLGFLDWTDSESVVDPTALISPYRTFTGGPAIPYDGATEHTYVYNSRLLTWEVNLWTPSIQHSLFHSSMVVGARYLRISEDFAYNARGIFAGGAILGTTDIEAENNILFTQLGFMCWTPIAKQVSARFDAKGGVGYNFAGQTTNIATIGNPAGDVNYSEDPDNTAGAFLADISAVLTWQLNCYIALYAGYQGLWLDELVLAPEQFNSTFPTSTFRPVLIDDTGTRLYHGVIGGLEITW